MLIDWFTVGAQVINFLILVWLMKRYLYQPILHAIDAREKRIAAVLSDADSKKAEAAKERDEFKHKNERIDQQRAELLRKAGEEASAEGQRLLDAARQAADALSTKRQNALAREQQSLKETVTRRTREEVFAIARKTLADLADVTLEERMTGAFAHRLRALNGEEKDSLDTALNESVDPAVVRSAFALPREQRAAIKQTLNEIFSAEIRLDFVTAPDLISGIELTASGQKIAWSIADYLCSMEECIGELTQTQAQTMDDETKEQPAASGEPE